jgi:hypothetical protein
MVLALNEHELEGLGEFEHEFEQEFEQEFEHEFELESELEMPEAFGFGDIKNWASRQWGAVRTPGSWQNTAVRLADRAILAAAPDIGAAIGGTRGQNIGKALQSAGLAVIPENWRESEFESEFEFEINPVTKVYPDAMMEHMALAAMEAESEHEAAEGFLPLIPLVASKLLPVAAKLLPKIASKVLPNVARSITRVTPQLTARRAMTTIVRQAASGRPVTPQGALRVLAKTNHRMLTNPRLINSVMRRSQVMDGQAHRISGLPQGVGHGPAATRMGVRGVAGAMRAGGVCPGCGATTIHARRYGCSPVIIVR